MSPSKIESLIRALRHCAIAYLDSGKQATADLLVEAAETIESMNALLADPDIVRKQ